MATSGEERNALTIMWRIENLSCYRKELHGEEISTFVFCSQTLKNLSMELDICPYDQISVVTGKRILLFLRTTSIILPVYCEFSLLACDGSSIISSEGIRDECDPFIYTMKDCPTQEELFITKNSAFLPHDTLTVRCRVWKTEGNFPQTEFISIRSIIGYAENSTLRPIAVFSDPHSSRNGISFLYLETFDETLLIELKYSLSGTSLQNSELNIEITIYETNEINLKLQVSLLDRDIQEVIKLGEQEKLFFAAKNKQAWTVPKFALGETLRKKMSLLQSGEGLSLLFRLSALSRKMCQCIEKRSFGTSDKEEEKARATSTFTEASCQTSKESDDTQTYLQPRKDCFDVLAEDFFSLYQKQTFSDFQLCCGDVSIPVHKSILCARSPVFNTMFFSKMKESNSNTLDVPDVDAHTLNRMLTFLYSGTVEPDLPLDSAAKLFYAADKYQVDSLKRYCSSILQSQISVSNVSDILTLADRHQDSNLTTFVHDFIVSHFDDVMYSPEWEKFMDSDPVLAGKSVYLLYKKKTLKNRQ